MHSFREALKDTSGTRFSIGENDSGSLVYADLADISHLLIAGATGTGKSTFLHGLLLTLIQNNSANTLRVILFDSKLIEFVQYKGIPHLLCPVITDPKKLFNALQWVIFEIEKRLKAFADSGNRSLYNYNDYLWENFLNDSGLPRILIIADDLTTAISSIPEIADMVQQIFLKGRTVGVHLIAATQTPTWKTAKNLSILFRSKILFSAATSAESRLLLGIKGAESLGPYGEAMFSHNGTTPIRIHTIMPTEKDFHSVLLILMPVKEVNCPTTHIISDIFTKFDYSDAPEEDELFPAAVEVVLETGQASASMLQRRLKLGYSRAARLVDRMEDWGIVGPFDGSKPRQLLITREQWQKMQCNSRQNEMRCATKPSVSESVIALQGTCEDGIVDGAQVQVDTEASRRPLSGLLNSIRQILK